MTSSSGKTLASVERAMRVVEFLADMGIEGCSLHSLSQSLGINKSTAHNTLATLSSKGWVEQDFVTGFYRLGEGLRPVANHFAQAWSAAEVLRPALESIRARFNELVHLGRLDGYRVVYLDKVEPDRAIRVVSGVGKQATAVRTAMGRSLLASRADRDQRFDWFFTDPVLSELDTSDLAALRKSTLENFDLFDREGWTQEIGENEEGIACVSVPVHLWDSVDLAISVTTPIERLPIERRSEIAAGIVEAVAMLPKSLGVSANLKRQMK